MYCKRWHFFQINMEPYEPNSSTECGNLHNSSPQCPFTGVDNNSDVLDVNVSLLEEVIRSFNRYEVTCRGRNLVKEVIALLSPSLNRKLPRSKSPLWRRSFGSSTGTRSHAEVETFSLLSPSTGRKLRGQNLSFGGGHSVLQLVWGHRGRNLIKEVIGLLSPSTGRKLPRSTSPSRRRSNSVIQQVQGHRGRNRKKVSWVQQLPRSFGPLTVMRSQRS